MRSARCYVAGMTRGDLCALLFGIVPVTAIDVARVACVSVDEVEAFYRTLRMAEMVDIDDETGAWFRLHAEPAEAFMAKVSALGIDIRQPVGRSAE